jgi:EAL domain-containing protein (putative c-di-GMP-specific phosphodiesterase class I)
LILKMSEWLVHEACREAALWPAPLRVAINLSPVQFQHGDLPNLIHSALLESGLAPDRLEVEVTEKLLGDGFSRAVSVLRRIKNLGVRVTMDDFGSGSSSLSNLQAFQFDKVKIDQHLVSSFDRRPESAATIRAVIGIARGLSLPVTAEGVETESQFDFLVREGCDEIQGVLIGTPQPIENYANVVGKPALAKRDRLARAR